MLAVGRGPPHTQGADQQGCGDGCLSVYQVNGEVVSEFGLAAVREALSSRGPRPLVVHFLQVRHPVPFNCTACCAAPLSQRRCLYACLSSLPGSPCLGIRSTCCPSPARTAPPPYTSSSGAAAAVVGNPQGPGLAARVKRRQQHEGAGGSMRLPAAAWAAAAHRGWGRRKETATWATTTRRPCRAPAAYH